jgi:serpin B
VILDMPKFKIEKKYELVKQLSGLGMTTPFSDEANFSAMKPVDLASGNPLDWDLKISDVIHQVFVEVEEKGTEAAAATALVEITVSGRRNGPPPPPPIKFRADHPFLFIIRDTRTEATLFIGRYSGETE